MYFAMDKSSQEHDEPGNMTEKEIYERRGEAADTAMNSITQSLITSVFGRTAPTKSPEGLEQNSSEVLADVLKRLQHLGSRGSRVLQRLSQQASVENASLPSTTTEPVFTAELETTSELTRERRQIQVARSELHKQLNRHDENMDHAMEDVSL